MFPSLRKQKIAKGLANQSRRFSLSASNILGLNPAPADKSPEVTLPYAPVQLQRPRNGRPKGPREMNSSKLRFSQSLPSMPLSPIFKLQVASPLEAKAMILPMNSPVEQEGQIKKFQLANNIHVVDASTITRNKGSSISEGSRPTSVYSTPQAKTPRSPQLTNMEWSLDVIDKMLNQVRDLQSKDLELRPAYTQPPGVPSKSETVQ
ncbi:uncharacterized protein EV422DRAFT_514606 [Fimicolochytrium jonesii]|uniref:uncharacterized protein n=1 Tax=Fimicolochytrium jonesii TaxID=1396493 RepID=UPI0022FEE6E2|nr:uncharacterized protein EV422DRAFT_514606 [Fimicolochytrium jonesii]KAI8825897.1 hypothetical protein EV422DRAFT_514606 [Fimicolochytrium jonesii]